MSEEQEMFNNIKSANSVLFSCNDHGNDLLRQLNTLREEELLFDVSVSDGQERSIRAHKIILAATFPYFKGCIHQNPDATIYMLKDFDWEAVGILIKFAYTGSVNVMIDKLQDVLELANFLGSDVVVKECCKIMISKIDINNIIGVLNLSTHHEFSELLMGAKQFAVNHLNDILNTADYINLSTASLVGVFNDDFISLHRNDMLLQPDEQEMTIFNILLRWAEYNWEARNVLFLKELIPIVRWSFISDNEIFEIKKQLNEKINQTCLISIGESSISSYMDSLKLKKYQPRYAGVTYWTKPEIFGLVRYFPSNFVRQSSDTNPLLKFDDSDLSKPTRIIGMEIYLRNWDGRQVIGGLKVRYSNGVERLHGEDNYDSMVKESFYLQSNERIVRVKGRSGWLVDELEFESNVRVYGPYGGNGGAPFCQPNLTEKLPQCHYLAAIKGEVYHTLNSSVCQAEDPAAVLHLQFVWGCLKSS